VTHENNGVPKAAEVFTVGTPMSNPSVSLPAARVRTVERRSILVILGLLLGVSALVAAAGLLWPGLGIDVRKAGRVGLAAVFVFTGIGHFARARGMAEMLPPWVPARVAIIWASGLLELTLAIGLLLPARTRTAGIAVIVFLILVFPANVSAAARRVDFGGHGAGPSYLFVRAPLQLLLIAWAWWFAVR
jgi:uncharacterized membrane protein